MQRLTALALAFAAFACGSSGGGSVAGAGGVVAPPSGLVLEFVANQPSPADGSSAMAAGSGQGDTITVEVRLKQVDGLRSAEFDIPYDAVGLEFMGYTPGTALEQSGQQPLYIVGTNSFGLITVAVNLLGAGSVDISGTHVLVGLTFRARTRGSYQLNFQAPVLRDGALQTIPTTWHSGKLRAD